MTNITHTFYVYFYTVFSIQHFMILRHEFYPNRELGSGLNLIYTFLCHCDFTGRREQSRKAMHTRKV